MALGFTQPRTEMGMSILSGGKAWPVRKANNLTAICEQVSRKYDILDISQSYRPLRTVSVVYWSYSWLQT
jgi:hypothetical protein